MAASPSKSTLESIITRYRREVSRNETPELEVRLQNVGYDNFAAIYTALLSQNSTGKLTQMVGIIMGDREARALRASRIREITFSNGKRIKEQFVRKEQLMLPFRVSNPVGVSYIVALSAEYANEASFISDEQALIRIKARISFDLKLTGVSELRPELQWRVDMTVTRQIMGSDAKSSLKQIIAQMFETTPLMTPETFLSVLNLKEPSIYQFEVEIEFASTADTRDMIRPADVSAAVEMILHLANPLFARDASMQNEIYHVAQYIIKAPGYLSRFQHDLGIKRLLPQALAITRADYRAIYPPVDYFLTEKADGKRALAIMHDDGRRLILTDNLIEFGTGAPGSGDTILDGELVTSDSGAIVFYAFDAIVVAGEDISTDVFEKRLGRLSEAVEILRKYEMPVVAKSYIKLGNPIELAKEIPSMYAGKYRSSGQSYKTDGLIFVEPGKSYIDTKNYKWKPPEHNTIDVLARRAPPSVLGKKPFIDTAGHKLYFLFVGINNELYTALGLERCSGYTELFGATQANYFPIQFSPSDVPLAYMYQHPNSSALEIEGRIIEVRCGGGCAAAGSGTVLPEWVITRVREDRKRELTSGQYFGNDFYTAELIWLNYVDPFPIEQLWEGPTFNYFMQTKSGAYRAQTAVISFAKTQRIAALSHANWVVDIGMGKGQDLGRYLDAEVRNLIAVDQDRAALSELVRRKYDFAKRRGDKRDRRRQSSTIIHILAANANNPFGQTLDKLEVLGLVRMTADAMVCNLAVHYFLSDMTSMRNFIALARGIVKIGGQIVLTVLIGEAVHAAFNAAHVAEGATWDVFEGTPPIRKYSLKRLYSSDALADAGQRIGVLLPFSSGQYYEEFLVNTKKLTAEFISRGFSIIDSTKITKNIPDFEARNRVLASDLTEGDKQWLSFYGELIYRRDK